MHGGDWEHQAFPPYKRVAVERLDQGLHIGFLNFIANPQNSGEIRLRGGSLSAARIKADYDMIKNRNFLTYGSVENGMGAE